MSVPRALAVAAVTVTAALGLGACGADRAERAALQRCVDSWNSRAANFNGQVLAASYRRRHGVEGAIVFLFTGRECGVAFALPAGESIQAVWGRPRGRQWNYWGALTDKVGLGELDEVRQHARHEANATMIPDGRLVAVRGDGIRQTETPLVLAQPRPEPR